MVTSGFYLEMNFDRIDTKIERGGIMDKIEIVIVTGMSGAGKTTAMAAFENMAYCCIDNYPIALLEALLEIKIGCVLLVSLYLFKIILSSQSKKTTDTFNQSTLFKKRIAFGASAKLTAMAIL